MSIGYQAAWERRAYTTVLVLLLGSAMIAQLRAGAPPLSPLPGGLVATLTSPIPNHTVNGTTTTDKKPHAMTVAARDAAGNTAASEAVTVTAEYAGASYSVIDLGTLGGATSGAQDIDNVGGKIVIVGQSTTASGARHAYLYRGGTLTDLGALVGGSYSQAEAVSDKGVVVGYGGINAYGSSFSEAMQAFLWENGTMRPLGALYCACSFNRRYGTSAAYAINTAGQVVGESETVRGERIRHAFLWQDGMMQDIGGGAGDWSISRAFAINDRGQVVGDFAQDVGESGSTSFDRRAFLWQNGVRRDLGVLPGHRSSTALAINETGQVVGWSGTSDESVCRTFLWEDGSMRDLGALPGDANSQALDINASGQVVGWSGSADRSVSRAFLWQGGRMLDLNSVLPSDSGWVLTKATAINDAGQIAGVGRHNGHVHAYLLNPKKQPGQSY